MDYFRKFIDVCRSLEKHKVDYILIGGVALILHGMNRLTQDIDIFIRIIPDNIEVLQKALFDVFHDNAIEEITKQELDQYPVIRYGTPDGFYIDIISRLGEAVSFDDLDYTIIKYEGVSIRVATDETLLKLKKNTVRERDKIDARFLEKLIEAKKA